MSQVFPFCAHEPASETSAISSIFDSEAVLAWGHLNRDLNPETPRQQLSGQCIQNTIATHKK